MSIYKNYTESDFEYWVFEMDDKLESFIASLYGGIKTQLDYSVNSLEKTEQWLINTYKTPETIDALHRAITVDGFCRYIGEVFRKKIGGYWDMSFKNSSDEQSGPYITGFDDSGRIIAPYLLMKKLLELKSGVYLRNYFIQLQELNK